MTIRIELLALVLTCAAFVACGGEPSDYTSNPILSGGGGGGQSSEEGGDASEDDQVLGS